MQYINDYHKRIDDEKLIVSEAILLQKKRVERYITQHEYDEDKVEDAINFIENHIKHYKGSFATKPFKLSLWQKYIISVCFGFYQYVIVDVIDVNGDKVGEKRQRRRLTREIFLVVSRKNGKSMFAAAVGLYAGLKDGEYYPEIYAAANTLQQVNETIYKTILGIIQKSPAINKRVRKRRTDMDITTSKGGSIRPLASDSKTLDGLNPYFTIFDEVHEFNDNGELFSVISTGQMAREEPMIFKCSSHGTTRGKVFDSEIDHMKKVLNGTVDDDTIQPFIYEQDNEAEVDDEMLWIKSNPNLGISVFLENLREKYKLMFDKPLDKNKILAKNFGVPKEQSTTFFSLQESDLTKDINIDDLMNDTYGSFGLDLSMSRDLTVLTYLFEKNNIRYIKQWYFMPKDKLSEKEKIDKVPYSLWAELGYLFLIEGDYIKPIEIFDFMLNEIENKKLYPQSIGYDRYYANEFATKCKEHFGDYMSRPVIQGAKTFSPALNKIKLMLNSKELLHNNPMLKWCLLNTTVRKDANNNITTDKKNVSGRIDGTDSLVDAFVVFEEEYSRGYLTND